MTTRWPAFTKWTPEYLVQKIGHLYVWADISADNQFDFYGEKWKMENVSFEFFSSKCASIQKGKKYYIAAQSIPELEVDVREPSFSLPLSPNSIHMWMGCGGQLTPIHPDPFENLMGVVSGEKDFLIFHPGDREYLYPIQKPKSPVLSSRIDDFENVDLDKFPLFPKARPFRIRVKSGEMLYLPAYWWHQVESEGRNIAVNFWYNSHSKILNDIIKILDESVAEMSEKK